MEKIRRRRRLGSQRRAGWACELTAQRGRLDRRDRHARQVAVVDYCPNWWPSQHRLLIRRVRLDASGRTRGRAGQHEFPGPPTAHPARPDQRALPFDELAGLDAVYGCSFVVTNLDVSSGERAAAVEHW